MTISFRQFGYDDAAFLVLLPLVVFVVIAVHEMGHYVVGRLCGFRVQAVQLGIGKKLLRWRDSGDAEWSVHLVPIAAYVQLLNFDDGGAERMSFRRAAFWRRLAVIAAGPVFNLVLPFILFLAFFTAFGQPSRPAVITAVEVGGPADEAGLRYGDRVLAIDGRPVIRHADIERFSYKAFLPETGQVYTVRRGEEVLQIAVRPERIRYTDIDGIAREHSRIGVVWRHDPFTMDALRFIGGERVKDDEEKAIRLLKERLGQEVELGIYSVDDSVRTYRLFLHEALHANLGDPDHEDFNRFYTGAVKYNDYLDLGFWRNVRDAFRLQSTLIAKIATVPFQLLPVDPELKDPMVRMKDPNHWAANLIYRCIFIGAMFSVALGLINLLPLPRLDGSYMLTLIIEAAQGRAVSKRQRALMLMGAFGVLYFSILLSNMDNLPGYIDSRAKKVQKFMNTVNKEE